MNKDIFLKLNENFKNRNIDVEYFETLEDIKLYI